jgi:twinkle protein
MTRELQDLAEEFLDSGRDGSRTPCPECSPHRRGRNVLEPVLSWSHGDNGPVYFCHHCGISGAVRTGDNDMRIEDIEGLFEEPAPEPPQGSVRLMADHIEYLRRRGISMQVAAESGLFTMRKFFRSLGEVDCIAFPYYDLDGVLISSKYRATKEKQFSQDPGAGGLLFGLKQKFDLQSPLVICEGEMDALSMAQAGIVNWVSVPAGAPTKGEKTNSQRFSWISELEDFLAQFKQYILATDNDAPGKKLQDELSKRLGRSKCLTVQYPKDCKDANDVLVKHGSPALNTVVEQAKPMTMTALYGADHYHDQVMDLFAHGDGKGESTGFNNVDELYTVAKGQMTVITGVPSSGKSNFLDQIMVNLASRFGWKFAIASMENEPSKHIAKLSEMYLRKPFFQQWPGAMTLSEAREAHAWCREHFCFIDFSQSKDLPTLDSLLDRAHAAVLRYGVDGLVIDPYNCIDIGKSKEQNETEAVSVMLSKVSAFAKASNIHVWFVAHPQKMNRDISNKTPVPTGYDISGSAHWYNKTDVGLTVHRRDTDGYVEIHCWKCRFKWVGRQGMCRLKYDIPTSTYYELPNTQDTQTNSGIGI